MFVTFYEFAGSNIDMADYYLGEFAGGLCTENWNFLLAEMEMTSELQGFVQSGTDNVVNK